MKKWMLAGLIVLAPYYASAAESANAGLAERAQQSRVEVKAFMGELKQALKSALKSGGPIAGVEVCSKVAPAIAAAQSHKTGWRVGRTSLRPRNPNNAPDAWEKRVLKKFEARKAAGEDPKKMEFYEVTKLKGKPVFRYMKAIPTAQKPCLACHGRNIKAGVIKKLDQHYPDDRARGYQAGDIRGAFSIIQPL
ncbi:MAG TPA: DUF3365 domain-containing protein [Gammaproteobacteria bacterium]|nr:DUF3365 domain-containing protein [Gammaproteobacteria bacterium]